MIGSIPIIRCPKGNAAEVVAEVGFFLTGKNRIDYLFEFTNFRDSIKK